LKRYKPWGLENQVGAADGWRRTQVHPQSERQSRKYRIYVGEVLPESTEQKIETAPTLTGDCMPLANTLTATTPFIGHMMGDTGDCMRS